MQQNVATTRTPLHARCAAMLSVIADGDVSVTEGAEASLSASSYTNVGRNPRPMVAGQAFGFLTARTLPLLPPPQ